MYEKIEKALEKLSVETSLVFTLELYVNDMVHFSFKSRAYNGNATVRELKMLEDTLTAILPRVNYLYINTEQYRIEMDIS